MKKMILTSLFSATLLFGSVGTTVFADELVPTDSSTPPIEVPTDPSTPVDPTEPTAPVAPPVDPVEPPVTPTDPTEPVEPTDPTEPTEPTEPSEPEKPVDPTEPTEPTEPTTPTEPSEPEKPTEPSKPVEPEKPVTPSKPTEPEKPAKPTQPDKPVDVVVTPNGEISHGGNTSQQLTVPIETSNVNEITHVPTPNTPITTSNGESIVAVLDGTPLKQTEEGLKPIQSDFKVLPSGNVEVKGNDGKLKVLPKTGEEMNVFLSASGGILSLVSGFIFFKKRQSMNNG
ncbi:TPA: LPXTG cell wall anchor domain-containing protein [Enterococcus faecium]|nr:LPXTG cell wall anchor domain-containing protein [Enterococcus faecium]